LLEEPATMRVLVDGSRCPAKNVEEQVAAEPGSGSINTRGDVLELVRNQLAEILEIEPGEIAESASFADDLNADSLALIELVEALEESLRDQVAGFRIDDDDLEDLRTVRDAVDYVTAKI
jgi:acyl carrier protein